jgi:hypothetical protein
MNWMIVWVPILEFLVTGLVSCFVAEKFKEIATMLILQLILYMVLINALLLYGYWIKH